MDTGNQNLRKQLAVAVKSIQWSYSIFWSISSTKPGVLEWGEGYYNGDIKTRKTVEAVEWDVDQMCLKRSEQLRELYESFLVDVETNPQSRIPSAALMPEDLSHTEWYYLVCMSFVFNLGQGLPGRAFENGKPMWLCNAHQTNSRVFSRSVLAKSASIQTVVCFPFLDGVVEMGTTDLVLEDHSLIQDVEASLLGIDSHCVYTSMTSNDYISQNLGYLEDPNYVSKIENEREIHPQEHDKTEDNCLMKMEPSTHDQSIDDLHYHNVLGSIFKTKHELIREPSFRHGNKESCFVSWNKGGGLGSYHNPKYGSAQRILKKILFRASHAHGSVTKDIQWNPETDSLATSHVLVERKRRERVNDRFCALKSLIPSIYKDDKVSILDDTIKYMKELERRVKELEVCQVGLDECCAGKTGTKPQDATERASDNYRNNKVGVKRKVGDVDFEGKMEDNFVSLRDSSTSTNLSISLIQKDVSIEMTCPHKQCLLLEIIDALSGLRLDAHSIQSSVFDGFLSLTIKAKIKGFGGLSTRMIREVLQRVVIRSG